MVLGPSKFKFGGNGCSLPLPPPFAKSLIKTTTCSSQVPNFSYSEDFETTNLFCFGWRLPSFVWGLGRASKPLFHYLKLKTDWTVTGKWFPQSASDWTQSLKTPLPLSSPLPSVQQGLSTMVHLSPVGHLMPGFTV